MYRTYYYFLPHFVIANLGLQARCGRYAVSVQNSASLADRYYVIIFAAITAV